MDLARRAMIGDVERDGGDRQIRVAAKIVVGQHEVPQVLAVGVRTRAPIVGSQAKLSAAGRRFQTAGRSGWKRTRGLAERHRRRVGLLGGLDRAALGTAHAVNPVVEAPLQAVLQLLDIRRSNPV